MQGLNRVLYNIDQRNDTTAAEKATARANIGAQGALTAGANITISDGVISAANTEYQAGHGLTLSNNTFAVDDSQLQAKLAAGSNIQINGNTISATDTKYTAGTNVQISQDNVISATDTKYTAGTNVQINSSNVISATDTKYTAGSNIQIDANNVISATDTRYTAGSGLALNGTEFSNTAPNVKSDWNAASGSSAEILNKPSVPSIKTVTTALPPVETAVSTMSLITDGHVTVNNSTDVGLLAPIGTQSDAGKVLTGIYSGSPGKFTASWTPVQSPLSAGNGISIANNVVSVKTKAGGGLDVGADGVYVKGHYVSYDANQGLNTTNQTNARNNINAFEAPDMTNAQPWQVVRLNENLKPTLGFAPSMYGGIYDANYGIIIGGDGNTWKKMPTIKLGATQEGATVTDNVYQIFAMPRFWDLDHWMITEGYALAWSRVEYTKNGQKYFDYQYRSVSLSSSANKHDLTTTYTGFANDGDSLHISLDLAVYALRSSSYSARAAMFHVDIFWGFYVSSGTLMDIGYWYGYSVAPCGAFNGSTLIWPVEN